MICFKICGVIKNKDFHWLVGILEGEGSFCFTTSPVISLNMSDKDIVEKARLVLQSSKVVRTERKNHPNHKPMYRTHLYGIKAVVWMKKLKKYMGKRRQNQIEKVLARYNPVIKRWLHWRNLRQRIIKLYNTKKYSMLAVSRKLNVGRWIVEGVIHNA